MGKKQETDEYGVPIRKKTDVVSVDEYGFNDRDVYEIRAKKVIVKKKQEFIEFNLSHIE